MWGIKTLILVTVLCCVTGLSLANRRARQRTVAQPVQEARNFEPDVYYDVSASEEQGADEQRPIVANPPPLPPSYEDSYQDGAEDQWDNTDLPNSEWDDSLDEDWENPVDPVNNGWENPAESVDAAYENPVYTIDDEGYNNPAGGQGNGWVKIQQPAEEPVISDLPAPVEDEEEEETDEYDEEAEEKEEEGYTEQQANPEIDWQAENKEEEEEEENDEEEERKPWFSDQVELRHVPIPAAPVDIDSSLPEDNSEELSDDTIDELESDEADDLDAEGVEYIDPENIELSNADTASSDELYDDYSSEEMGMSSETSEETGETSEETGETSEETRMSSKIREDETDKSNSYENVDQWPSIDADEVESDGGILYDTSSPEPSADDADAFYYNPEASSSVSDGRRRGPFTAWHYAIFAIAGAVFLLALVVIVGVIIRAMTRRSSPIYRRLQEPRVDPVKV